MQLPTIAATTDTNTNTRDDAAVPCDLVGITCSESKEYPHDPDDWHHFGGDDFPVMLHIEPRPDYAKTTDEITAGYEFDGKFWADADGLREAATEWESFPFWLRAVAMTLDVHNGKLEGVPVELPGIWVESAVRKIGAEGHLVTTTEEGYEYTGLWPENHPLLTEARDIAAVAHGAIRPGDKWTHPGDSDLRTPTVWTYKGKFRVVNVTAGEEPTYTLLRVAEGQVSA